MTICGVSLADGYVWFPWIICPLFNFIVVRELESTRANRCSASTKRKGFFLWFLYFNLKLIYFQLLYNFKLRSNFSKIIFSD